MPPDHPAADRAELPARTDAHVADAYVVVSWWQPKGGERGPGSLEAGAYEYEHRPTLNDALDTYREYEDGEYARARAVGIFAVRNGLPIAGRLDPFEVMSLMQETRQARG